MKKKILTSVVLVLCAALLVVVSVLGTMAYLTSSAAVTNAFTVGNVGITMFESAVNQNGVTLVSGETKKTADTNTYLLVPGTTYTKDPTVYVNADSVSSYLFVKVRNTIVTIEDTTGNKPTIAQQLANHGWMEYQQTATGTVYVFCGIIDSNATNVDLSSDAQYAELLSNIKSKTALPTFVGTEPREQAIDVFDSFTIAKNADVSLFGGAKVIVTAFAIQSSGDGITNVETAWKAIVDTYPYESGATSN